VAGWNIVLIHGCRGPFGVLGFGTLLGPEETPGGVFSGAAPGLGRLTHPCGCGGGRIGLGCGCVLSVA
jgi:hypothetical protein